MREAAIYTRSGRDIKRFYFFDFLRSYNAENRLSCLTKFISIGADGLHSRENLVRIHELADLPNPRFRVAARSNHHARSHRRSPHLLYVASPPFWHDDKKGRGIYDPMIKRSMSAWQCPLTICLFHSLHQNWYQMPDSINSQYVPVRDSPPIGLSPDKLTNSGAG